MLMSVSSCLRLTLSESIVAVSSLILRRLSSASSFSRIAVDSSDPAVLVSVAALRLLMSASRCLRLTVFESIVV